MAAIQGLYQIILQHDKEAIMRKQQMNLLEQKIRSLEAAIETLRQTPSTP